MTTQTIKELIENKQWRKLIDQFEAIDKKDNSINKWQVTWSLPLDEKGCHIAHKLRNKIMAFCSHYDGVKHLDGKKYQGIATKLDAANIVESIDYIKENRDLLNMAHKVFSSFYCPDQLHHFKPE